MFDNPEKRRQLAKWVIGVVAACVLIYLALRHMATIADAVMWLVDLTRPLLVGVVLALILNVPMSFIETKFLAGIKRGKRPLAIILSMVLVIGLFVAVAFLVVPELVAALRLIVQIITDAFSQLAQLESNGVVSENPLVGVLERMDVDWSGLGVRLESWFESLDDVLIERAVGALASFVNMMITGVLGLVFSIYILAQKETLKRQVSRLLRAWLPARMGEGLIHVSSVCSETFKLFIAGQTTDAIILGILCMIGMAILRIPYAPMVGALIGVTALVPIVGAWVGAIIAIAMILTVNPFKAFVFLIFLLSLQQVDNNFIYPRIVGRRINLPAVWVLASITVGGNLGGPVGMLLGVPIAASAYSLLREATHRREKDLLHADP